MRGMASGCSLRCTMDGTAVPYEVKGMSFQLPVVGVFFMHGNSFEEFFVDFLDVDSLLNTAAYVESNHQPRQLNTVNENDLNGALRSGFASRCAKRRCRHEQAFGCCENCQCTEEVPYLPWRDLRICIPFCLDVNLV